MENVTSAILTKGADAGGLVDWGTAGIVVVIGTFRQVLVSKGYSVIVVKIAAE